MADPAYGASSTDPFASVVNAFTGSNNPIQQVAGNLGGATALQQGLGQVQASALGMQYGYEQQQYGLTNANLEQQAANQLAQIGIQNQQLDISAAGTEQQAQLLQTTTGLEKQEYTASAAQYPEQLAQAALNYQNNLENLRGNLGATGAAQTMGASQQIHALGSEYGWQTQDINRAQQIAGLEQQGTEAQQKYSAQEIANQQANLQLVAEANGLSAQEVEQQLAYGLSQSNLTWESAGPQFLSQLSSIWGGELQNVEQGVAAAGLLAGTNVVPAGLKG